MADSERKKASRARARFQDVLDRLDEVERAILAGTRPRVIEREMADKHGITRSQARRYIQRSKVRLASDVSSVDREAAFKDAVLLARETFRIARLKASIRRAYDDVSGEWIDEAYLNPDVKGMVSALKLLADLYGAYKADAKEPTLTQAEVDAAIAKALNPYEGMSEQDHMEQIRKLKEASN